jgi:hypothetical protein
LGKDIGAIEAKGPGENEEDRETKKRKKRERKSKRNEGYRYHGTGRARGESCEGKNKIARIMVMNNMTETNVTIPEVENKVWYWSKRLT